MNKHPNVIETCRLTYLTIAHIRQSNDTNCGISLEVGSIFEVQQEAVEPQIAQDTE